MEMVMAILAILLLILVLYLLGDDSGVQSDI
jgi:hypothetical protein